MFTTHLFVFSKCYFNACLKHVVSYVIYLFCLCCLRFVFVLSLANPCQERNTEHKASSKDKSLSRVLFMGKFNLTPEAFDEGLRNQEFFEVTDAEGRKRYSWNVLEQGTTHLLRKGTVKEGVKDNLDANEVALQDAIFDSWKMGLFKSSQKAIKDGAPSSSSGTLALLDREVPLDDSMWGKAQSQLSNAIQAFEKMERDSKKSLQAVGVDAKDDPLHVQLKLDSIGLTGILHTYKIWLTPAELCPRLIFLQIMISKKIIPNNGQV